MALISSARSGGCACWRSLAVPMIPISEPSLRRIESRRFCPPVAVRRCQRSDNHTGRGEMEPKQVGQGRLVAGLGGLLLFGFLFLPWFGDARGNLTGWEGQTTTDLYMLITAMVAVAAALPGTRALLVPGVTMSGAATLLGGVATMLLIWLSFIDVPSGEGREVGIYLGLLAAILITVAGFMSSRVTPA